MDIQNNIPLVSVIVPNYNYEKFLSLRIESILQQSFQDFELILLDDCSTDKSAEVLKSYAANCKVSHVVLNDVNTGSPFLQWKKGLELARGQFVWVAESDDWADPTLLKKAVDALLADPQVVLCQVGAHIVDQDGVTYQHWDRWHKWKKGQTLFFDGKEFIHKYLKWGNVLYNASGIVFRKDAVGSAFDMVKGFRVCGDWLFWEEMARHGKVAIVCEYLNYFRRHRLSVCHKAPSTEDYDCFRSFVQQGFFSRGSWDFYVMVGALQKGIRDKDSQYHQMLSDALCKVSGVNSNWPFFFSELLRFANKFSPLCIYPPFRRM